METNKHQFYIATSKQSMSKEHKTPEGHVKRKLRSEGYVNKNLLLHLKAMSREIWHFTFAVAVRIYGLYCSLAQKAMAFCWPGYEHKQCTWMGLVLRSPLVHAPTTVDWISMVDTSRYYTIMRHHRHSRRTSPVTPSTTSMTENRWALQT
jgi:hypothetical protein